MTRFRCLLFGLLMPLILSSCIDITHVQTGYVADRDQCRSNAENNVGVYSQPDAYPLSNKERNTALLQLFCECMKEKDWKVAGCARPPVAVAAAPATQPTVVVVQSPTTQPAVLPYTPAPVTAPIAQGVHKKKKACVPANACAAPGDYNTGTATPGSTAQTPATPTQQTDQQLNSILQKQ